MQSECPQLLQNGDASMHFLSLAPLLAENGHFWPGSDSQTSEVRKLLCAAAEYLIQGARSGFAQRILYYSGAGDAGQYGDAKARF
jgi:hypothetical protein